VKWVTADQGFSEIFTPAGLPRPHYGPLVGSLAPLSPASRIVGPPNKGIFRGNAREALRAEVHTRRSAPKAVATLHEEVEQIDLPVFQEIPARTHDWTSAVVEDAAAQQQQQQQQQQR
jgi:hypothetical protein